MTFLPNHEAAIWCKAAPRSLTLHEETIPSYGGQITHGLKYEVPLAYWALVNLLFRLLTIPTEGSFEGGLVWQLNWWREKESEKVTLKTIEKMRQGHGELRPLEDAPACLFETGDLYDAIAFLVQPFLNAWAAQFVSASGRYIITSTVSGYLYFTPCNKAIVDRVFADTAGWKPWHEIPGIFKHGEYRAAPAPRSKS
jgi:hypothetical protein